MIDGCGRTLNYLRLSVTDRCNLRCRYCMPEEGVTAVPHAEVLSFDEIGRLVGVMAGLGINRVRLTGGEPLVRRGIAGLAAQIKAVPGIDFLGLTTNGVLLPQLAGPLYEAGVDGLNISIDTLDRQRYAALTRRDLLPQVLAGLDAALALPFKAVKVNCVLAPDSLDSDWLGVIGLAREKPIDVRLIEWMPMAEALDGEGGALPADGALRRIEAAFGAPTPVPRDGHGGPASLWALPGFAGRVGIIPAMSHKFCQSCNRLRLTATGDLKLCLFYDVGAALKPLLRGGGSNEAIAAAIREAIKHKPLEHAGAKKTANTGGDKLIDHPCGMYGIGG